MDDIGDLLKLICLILVKLSVLLTLKYKKHSNMKKFNIHC